MGLPWPFAGAGLSFLPKPGKWMVRVKYGFGVLIAGVILGPSVTHLVPEPRQRTADGYMKSIEAMATLLRRADVAMVEG